MEAPGNSRLVFLSHSGEDTWVAKQIAKCIEFQGAQAFLDEADVDVGAEFEEEILNFLDKADEFIVLFTPWSQSVPMFGPRLVRHGVVEFRLSLCCMVFPSMIFRHALIYPYSLKKGI